MAYVSFDSTVPNAATQDGTDVCDAIRDNQEALRDAVVLGAMEDWDLTVTAGTGSASEPQYLTYDKGAERLRATLTWGTTGGEDGNVTQSVYAYSSNSGSSYDTIGTLAVSYDSNGNVTATTWS